MRTKNVSSTGQQKSQAKKEQSMGNLLSSINELVECISGDNVATDEPDGRVEIHGLLAEDGAGEHRVVPALHA